MQDKNPSELLDDLRDKWANDADLIERLYGKECPIAIAFRLCISQASTVQLRMQDYERKYPQF